MADDREPSASQRRGDDRPANHAADPGAEDNLYEALARLPNRIVDDPTEENLFDTLAGLPDRPPDDPAEDSAYDSAQESRAAASRRLRNRTAAESNAGIRGAASAPPPSGAAAPGPTEENPFAGPTADEWGDEGGLEVRYDAGSRWMLPMGVVMFVGAVCVGGAMWRFRGGWNLDEDFARLVMIICAMGFSGLVVAAWGLQRRFGPKVQLRISKDGFRDFRTGTAFSWSEVREVGLDYASFEGSSAVVPLLRVVLDLGDVERHLAIRMIGLDQTPERIAKAVFDYASTDPAAYEGAHHAVILAGFREGRSIDAVAAQLVERGLDPASARREVAAATGGAGSSCARCRVVYDPAKQQCPDCWEALTPVALPADG